MAHKNISDINNRKESEEFGSDNSKELDEIISNNAKVKLPSKRYKGDNGTILIIGGSDIYTGAPYFTAIGAMRSGAELVYIFTSKLARCSLKGFYESIVMLLDEDNDRIFDKVTACVVGPGLGRIDNQKILSIENILKKLDRRGVPVILDADAIHYYKSGFYRFLKKCILTPNHNEFIGLDVSPEHLCILKGEKDLIFYGNKDDMKRPNKKVLVVDCQGSSKRCGGLGDVLAGVLSVFVHINKYESNVAYNCKLACELTRKAAHEAFVRYGYGLITSDVIKCIPKILWDMKHLFDMDTVL